ncbi:aromatic ring-hydroxylating oxygenase subunit alpha [Pseudogemmobacter faecipullorum]|uniref:Aromatic ring-hydroxylating dioxygenase subunit alpha n=1 Tax=Pseudogemmobacter faecipullorum TaxID=2755041 RepID=A0ABS8CPZ6_9RHOB|nr:aromatic ring-hydroxylating dioxygenase subunit alpha [Pseudogemmobacter faecipullorum]MCB5411471.1 aromatic ring-hydroxylating dioxygenase subunit alpha [Pseudogemmobacter faecipullorum]
MTLPFTSDPVPENWDRRGLPAWCYHSAELFALEREEVFLRHWQVVGHISDLPAAGDWLGFDLLDERAVIIRGQDGVIRAFMNLCRHRGARVVEGSQGQCRSALICPFHGWVYNFDGTLRGVARPETFGEGIDKAAFALKPLELEIFGGFLFLRFRPGPQPSVAEWLAPYAAEFAAWQSERLQPLNVVSWSNDLPVNWKSVRDVDNEGYHVALAHPGLQDLYGRDYRDIYLPDGLHISYGFYGDRPGRGWSVRNYVKHSPLRADLPPHLRRNWAYYGLFPNTVIAFTPESAQFYQDLPLSPGQTRLTGRQYRLAQEDRQTRVARYLAQRIDRETSAEDQQLSIWSNESMRSGHFEGFHLSDLEYGLRRHHDQLRALLPVMQRNEAPDAAEIRALNKELACQTLARP